MESLRRLLRPLRAPADTTVRIAGVRVGIVDVGANTLRLLVAAADGGRVEPVREDRVQLGLGEEIERTGSIGAEKLEETASTAREHVRKARKLGCAAINVLVTSPGRQARNGAELVARLAEATGVLTRVLSAEEESALAWRGALAAAEDLPETVAVCDVGGGSAQIAVGRSSGSPAWVRSIDIGSLRLARRAFRDDPPDAEDLARAQKAVEREFADIAPPLPLAAIAVGGTARALRRVIGNELGEDELRAAVHRLTKRSARKIAKEYGVDDARARTITAGALIFLEVQRRLGVPLQVGRSGLREGAALALLAEAQASAKSA
jgi:exopolyphosphatase / guanosine-5'-triphosphate,3'-diphosphate pyrophosphatase